MNDEFRYVGQSIPRVEDERLLRGWGAYIDDVPEPPDTLHLAFVRSPHAHALIRGVDGSRALEMPGVVAVLDGAEISGMGRNLVADYDIPDYKVTEWPLMTPDRARFVGDTVAVVLAESPYVAEDALERVEIEYEVLDPLIGLEAALAPDAPLVHPEIGDNVPFRKTYRSDGFEAAWKAAGRVFSTEFRSSRIACVSLEPRGALAVYDRGRGHLTFYASTQVPHLLRTALSEHLDWPETGIRVVTVDVGGGFGMKAHIYPEEVVTAALARRFRCSIKWIQDRVDDLLTSTQARDYKYAVSMALDEDAVIQAVRAEVFVNIGAYSAFPYGCSAEAGGGAIYLPGPQQFKHYAYETRSVFTHTCPTSVYRGVAAPVANTAFEGLMDKAARELGIDPAEFRRRNLVRDDQMPFVNAIGIKYESGSYRESLERALVHVDYDRRRAAQPRSRLVDGAYRGIGIAATIEHTGQGASRYRARGILRLPGFDSALVRIEPDGKVVAHPSHAQAGQGHITTFAQIVADRLGVRFEDVTIAEGDTADAPYGTGTFASRAAVTGGGALIKASNRVREKILRAAGALLEVSPADLELRDGEASVKGVPGLSVGIKDIAAIAYAIDDRPLPEGLEYGLEATDFYDPEPGVSITNGTYVAAVSIDAATGRIRVDEFHAVHDCGRVINPMVVAGQVHGGIAQALGQALCEAVRYDGAGQLLTGHLLDYLIPMAGDVPDITVEHLESPSPDTLGGFKGSGEGGVMGGLPAIVNAVNDALSGLGVAVDRLPMTPDYVLELIDSATTAA